MNNSGKHAHEWRRIGAGLVLAGALIFSAAAGWASTPPSSTPNVLTLNEAAAYLRIGPEELERLAASNEVPGRRVGSRWRFNRQALLAWLNGEWTLITTTVPTPAGRGSPSVLPDLSLSRQDMAEIIATGTNVAQAGGETKKKKKQPANGEEPIGEAPEERTAEDVFLRGQKVLLAPGDVTVDVGQFFSQVDNQQLVSVGGGVGLATVDQETFTTFVLGRVGVFDETELFASTTYRNQSSDVFLGSAKLAESDRSEFGDVRLGIRRTLLKEGPGYPDIIATIDGRIPTGDTSWGVGGGLALVKSIDPVVLFANANYRHTFSRDFSDLSRLEPEDRFDVSMGYALALNDTLTISTSVSGVFSGATSFDNATLRQQDSYSLSLGLTSWLAKGLYIEPSVSFGLSGPSDSVSFGVTVPYSF